MFTLWKSDENSHSFEDVKITSSSLQFQPSLVTKHLKTPLYNRPSGFEFFVGEDNFYWGGSCYVDGSNEETQRAANAIRKGYCIIQLGSRGC